MLCSVSALVPSYESVLLPFALQVDATQVDGEAVHLTSYIKRSDLDDLVSSHTLDAAFFTKQQQGRRPAGAPVRAAAT